MRELLMFLLLFCTVFAKADDAKYYDTEIDGIFYKFDKNANEATVVPDAMTSYTNFGDGVLIVKSLYSGDVVIPESVTYNGTVFKVTGIAGGKFTFSGSGGAFDGCTELTSITIPKTIKYIGSNAFKNCTSLSAVYITDLSSWCNISFAVTDAAESGYRTDANPLCYAHNLYLDKKIITDLVIPDDITNILDISFVGCNIKSVRLPKTIVSIGEGAFDECNSLKDIVCYSSKIDYKQHRRFCIDPFSNKENKALHIRERYKDNFTTGPLDVKDFGKVEYIQDIDFYLIYCIDNEEYKNIWCEVGETITPEVEPIKEGYTFSGWSEIPETMPDHDVTITGSFSPNTYKLTYNVDGEEYKVVEVKCDEAITAEPEPTRKGMTFSGWSEIPEKMPGKDVDVTGTFSWLKNTVSGVIYEVSDTINNRAAVIGNDKANGDVKIVSPVKFDYDYSITDIVDFSFKGNTDITSVVIPESVRKIGDEAFYGCKNLAKIELGKSVNQIEPRAFAGIDKLTDITVYAEDVPDADRTAFENSYTEDYVTLHVPAKALEKYKSAAPWKNFKEIVAIEGTESEPAKYTLIYQVDGETYKTFELEEGAEITALEEPTKEGYTFSGWSTIPATMPAKDIIITGTFTKNETEEVDTGEDVIMISGAGQTTWCSKYDLDFTDIEGLKAYIAPGYDRESGTIWLMRVFKVPAGEGILLMGDPNEYRVPHKPTTTYYTNMFVGTTEPKTIYESENGYTNYYLSSGTSGVGFYRVTDADGVQLKANRAYLPLKTSTQASTRGFIGMEFGEDGTTGMRNLTPALSKGEGVYYNLQGQPVDKPGKGLYILNGKKVVVK